MVHPTFLVVLICLILLCLFPLDVAADNSSTISDPIRLDCGASTTTGPDIDNRTWDGKLDLTFAPSTHRNGSYAFMNGIEIVPTHDLFTTQTPTLANGGKPNPFIVDPTWGFQTMYRLNVGGLYISPRDDVDFYRVWNDDSPYIGAGYGVTFGKDNNVTIKYTPSVPNYTAPVDVYATARSVGIIGKVNLSDNLTWILPVDAGFYYLVRFHFCEIQYHPTTEPNQGSSFSIYINYQTAQEEMDVLGVSGGIGKTVYRDYVTVITGFGQMELFVSLQPDMSRAQNYHDAILNGLEIFKLQTDGANSLAGLNSPLPPSPNMDQNETSGR
ncbi:hypothetical protein EJB05_34838, partial [Eragrostis curvula]